jgi:hypothetical protein
MSAPISLAPYLDEPERIPPSRQTGHEIARALAGHMRRQS